MKIKLENHIFFGNCEFDFTDGNGKIFDNIIVAGENGSGKTQLLNLIYDFSSLVMDAPVRQEKRFFYLSCTESDFLVIKSLFDKDGELSYPGELLIIKDFSKPSYSWQRYSVYYHYDNKQSQNATKKFNSNEFFENDQIKQQLGAIFSTVEINYNPNIISNRTAKEIDEKFQKCLKSGDDLATEIQQLLIDIETNDAIDVSDWVKNNPGTVVPENIQQKRMKRFTKAFSAIFSNLNFNGAYSVDGKIKVLFEKLGKKIDISELSSGEKQIVFRGSFLLQNQQSTKGCLVLIDEPEISMHPLWQTKIFDYYRNLFIDDNGQTSQIFMATHSQYVLGSALNKQDVLILALKNTSGGVRIDKITAPFVLPIPTSAELNYFIFNIISIDYHIQLYGYLQNLIKNNKGWKFCSVKKCDDYILSHSCYDARIHEKKQQSQYNGNSTEYNTLPTYLRNLIDHPELNYGIDEEELAISIKLLIDICRNYYNN